MIEVSIPSMEREVDQSGKSKKLFRVEVLFNGRKHFVLRRSSEFQALHRKLRKIVQTPDFPSKRNSNLRTKPLEQRRQELEGYIQDIIYQDEDVPQVLLDFLHVKHFHTGNKVSSMDGVEQRDCFSPVLSVSIMEKDIYKCIIGWYRSLDDLDSQDYSDQLPHQRVFGFFQDPFVSDRTSDLPDVVVDGVLQGLYPRDVRVSFTAPDLTEPDPTPSIDA